MEEGSGSENSSDFVDDDHHIESDENSKDNSDSESRPYFIKLSWEARSLSMYLWSSEEFEDQVRLLESEDFEEILLKICEIDENNEVNSEEEQFLNSQNDILMKYSNDEIIQKFFKNFQDLMQTADCADFESRFDHMNICRDLYEGILDILKSFIIMNISKYFDHI